MFGKINLEWGQMKLAYRWIIYVEMNVTGWESYIKSLHLTKGPRL